MGTVVYTISLVASLAAAPATSAQAPDDDLILEQILDDADHVDDILETTRQPGFFNPFAELLIQGGAAQSNSINAWRHRRPWERPQVTERMDTWYRRKRLSDWFRERRQQLGRPEPATSPVTATYDVPMYEHPLVDAYVDYFTGRGRKIFAKWLARSGRYIPIMQPILAAAGLPEDLVYIAMIESGFNVKARSWASAVGPWQFMPRTGNYYGLKTNTWVDERRDFILATQAAARYLKHLYGRFDDWPLAWAGYNAGGGRVSGALKRFNADDFWSLADEPKSLAQETRHYVPKFLAALRIARNPGHYGFANIEPHPALTYDTIDVDSPTSLKTLATALNLDLGVLRLLNPALKHDVTPPGQRYHLRLPAGQGPKVIAWLAKRPAHERVSYAMHKVRRGENLTVIARKYGSRVQAIVDFNRIRRPKALQIGTRLIVPSFGDPPKVAKRSKKRKARRARSRRHRVRRGETLWAIARRYDVSVKKLKHWNKLRSDVIHAGSTLKIF